MIDIACQPWSERARKNTVDFFQGKRKLIFLFNTAPAECFCGLQGLRDSKTGTCKRVLNHDVDLQAQLEQLSIRFDSGLEDDYIYRLKPYTGVGMIASAFGCKTEFPDNGDPTTHPVIHDINAVDSLVPSVKTADLIQLTFDKIRYFLDMTQGELPIASPGLLSPINVASIICDYTELLCGTLTAPDKVHQLLNMITEVMIEVLDKLRELVPEMSFSHEWFLPTGIWLSDDLMAVMSPGQYEQFEFPYNNKLSHYANGVFIHSCGDPLKSVQTARKYHRIMGMEFWEVTIADFHEAGGDFPCACPVVEDAWHNLDRRQSRTRLDQAFEEAMADLEKLPAHTDLPVIFEGICPEPRFAREYHHRLMAISEEVNRT